MPGRAVYVHLLPTLVDPAALRGAVAVVIDVLRASTTIVHALGAGATEVRPCGEVEEARRLAAELKRQGLPTLLGGERGGVPIPGFDLGNSPQDYTRERCSGRTVVLTTTNGTRALLTASSADRVLIGSLVNLGAVVATLCADDRPLHLVCAGTDAEVTLEDVLCAGALIAGLSSSDPDLMLNDSAKLALAAYHQHRENLLAPLLSSRGAANLLPLGYEEDIHVASRRDSFSVVPELRRDPLRLVLT